MNTEAISSNAEVLIGFIFRGKPHAIVVKPQVTQTKPIEVRDRAERRSTITPGLALTGGSNPDIRPGYSQAWKAATVPGLTTGRDGNETKDE